jgi:hypothetical protein
LSRAKADLVIGCDVASNTARRELFGAQYPDETLNAQLVTTKVWQCLARERYITLTQALLVYYDFNRDGLYDSTI